ncbi:MAG: isoprenylcysteine carboxylmethyltransferase family protein [Deltaproteobacteria bacterium]|nr:isoprenylcysteine carboxylmethyltransferase family protein [Deltaproteobacteria bacterium]
MSRHPFIENSLKTFIFAVIALFVIAYIPYRIITAETHTVIAAIGKFRLIGYILIGLGTVGYLICFRNFIVDANGSPILGDTQYLIVKGLYRYVRNPIYLSANLIFLGEALLFQSLEMLYYLLGWIIIFHLFVVFVEEPFLRHKFGDTYERYCNSVRRWVPRIKPPGNDG